MHKLLLPFLVAAILFPARPTEAVQGNFNPVGETVVDSQQYCDSIPGFTDALNGWKKFYRQRLADFDALPDEEADSTYFAENSPMTAIFTNKKEFRALQNICDPLFAEWQKNGGGKEMDLTLRSLVANLSFDGILVDTQSVPPHIFIDQKFFNRKIATFGLTSDMLDFLRLKDSMPYADWVREPAQEMGERAMAWEQFLNDHPEDSACRATAIREWKKRVEFLLLDSAFADKVMPEARRDMLESLSKLHTGSQTSEIIDGYLEDMRHVEYRQDTKLLAAWRDRIWILKCSDEVSWNGDAQSSAPHFREAWK